MSQEGLMRFDPKDGSKNPYPSHAKQYREWHGNIAWLFNPWSGKQRHAADIGSDALGYLMIGPGEETRASACVVPRTLWLWKNFVDGIPEYWAFDNAFPIHMDSDDPQTLGEPCGYVILKDSRRGRMDVSDEDVKRRMIAAAPQPPTQPSVNDALLTALEGVLNRYTGLVNCGDCGNWNPEEEDVVVNARKAIAEAAKRGES